MEQGSIQRDEMQATDVASFLSKVQMPTVQHLLTGSLDSIRASICAISPEQNSQQWVALHMVLGTALRLRAPFMNEQERTGACAEAIRAFERALAECCEHSPSRSLRSARVGSNQFSLQTNGYAPGPDGVQMVVDATTVPLADGIEMLECAIGVFQETASSADPKTDPRTWITARSNLGCALTLLGRRMPGLSGLSHIEEAIEVLTEAAFGCSGNDLQEERASAYVNLSEAHQALSERALPTERLRHIERSLDWMAAALGFFAPLEYQGLLQLDRAGFA